MKKVNSIIEFGGARKLETKKRIKEYYTKAFDKEIVDGTVIILS